MVVSSARAAIVSTLMVLLQLQATCVLSKIVDKKKGVTLTFVFDSTGSMYDELQQVKDGTQAIFKMMYEHPDKPIYNYALVPFNDPSVGPATVTTDPVTFNNSLKAITVSGGGDCPELSMSGIKLGVEKSLLGSYVFVFTDASAKDYYLKSEVENIIQRKQTQVVFVLTGDCIGEADPGFQAYRSIASTSNGQVFNIKKHEVKNVLDFIKDSVKERNKVVIISVNKPEGGESTFPIPVDATMLVLTMALSGEKPKIELTDPHGIERFGHKILDIPGGLVIKIDKPEPGVWTVKTSSTSGHEFIVSSVSEFNFDFGFSRIPTTKMSETSHRPLEGVETSLLIMVTNQTELSHLTKLKVIDVRAAIIKEATLNPVEGTPGLYSVDMFVPPTSLFKLQVYGKDAKGNEITRITPTAISTQPAAAAIVNLPATLTAPRGIPFDIICDVESLVPFTATWLKDGHVYGSDQSFKQSAEVILHLPDVTKASAGKFTCRVKNKAGEVSQDTQFTTIAPPPQVDTPEEIMIRPGEKGELLCTIESEEPYKVSWSMIPSLGSSHPVSGSRFNIKSTGNLVINPVAQEDEGLFICTAESSAGKGESRIRVDVKEPVRVTVTPSLFNYELRASVTLTCSATGSPPIQLEWKRDGRVIKESDEKFEKPAPNTLNLVLKNMDRGSEGEYTCEAKNGVDNDTGVAKLVYQEIPTATLVESYKEALRGSGVLIECFVTGVPEPEVSWSVDGKKITPGTDFFILDSGGLSIPAVPYGGVYKCSATNKVGNAEDTMTLDVGTLPEFIVEPHDMDIKILSDDSIPCEISGEPKPVFSWRRTDSIAINPERFTYDETTCTLKVTEADIEDEGTYVVTIKNKFGEKEKEINITIVGIEPPVINKSGELNITAKGNEFLELSCEVLKGYPPPDIIWFKDGELLDETFKSSTMKENGSLVIPFVTLKNEGHYECEAINIGGKAKKNIDLSVIEPPIISRPKRTIMKVRKERDIWLPCVVQGTPKPFVEWKKDGGPLPSRRGFGRSTKHDSLLIKKIQEIHNGTYECVASNAAGAKEKIIDVLVIEPPKIISHEEEVFYAEETPVTLNCEASAFPPAEMKWLKNGIPLSEDRFTYSDDNSTISFQAMESDSDQYECVATNIGGEDRSTTNVTILVSPKFETDYEVVEVNQGENVTLVCYADAVPHAEYFWSSSNKDVLDTNEISTSTLTLNNVQQSASGSYICDASNYVGNAYKMFYVIVKVPPKIHDELPETTDLTEDSYFNLPCSADGTPKPEISWQKNGKIFFSSDAGEDHILVIRGATREDSGLYTCTAVNSQGTDRKSVVVNVLVPPVMNTLEIPVVEVVEGRSQAVVSCPAIEANPPPTIDWFKNRRYIKTEKKTLRVPRDKGRTLVIKKVTMADEGEYTCVASNSAGRTSADITLKVLKEPVFKDPYPILNINEIEGANILMDCAVTGKPPPKVTWFRNGHVLLDMTVPGLVRSSDNQEIRINGAKIDDGGEYKCVAENKVGKIEQVYTLEIVGNVDIEAVHRDVEYSVWGKWSPWSPCSATCGNSERVRVRKCVDETIGCLGPNENWGRCYNSECQIDGGWNKWSDWSVCSTTCGSGKRKRSRKCNKPRPSNGGKSCEGDKEQYEVCNSVPCPVDGAWSEWSEWTLCGGPCSNSTRRRTRQCTDPHPAFGGSNCTGKKEEYTPCLQKGCPVDGQWSPWSPWSACSATCGPSNRIRTRNCSEPEPQYGGNLCDGEDFELETCDVDVCDGIPLKAFIRVKSTINGQKIKESTYNVIVTDLESQRNVEASMKDIFIDQPGWFPYLQFFQSPLAWTTAFQKNGATNGHSLTQDQFHEKTHIHFDSGETLVFTFTGHGLREGKLMEADIDVKGDIPILPVRSSVSTEPYEEDYVQTGPGELFATSSGTLDASGIIVNYSWNKTITYYSGNVMPYLVQTLSVWDMKNEYNPSTSKLSHKVSSSIEKKLDTDSCPEGFQVRPDGTFCQDIDECAESHLNNCHITQTCENRVGSYYCACPSGYQAGSIGAHCEDIDECRIRPDPCSHYCINTEGSFKCLCPPGLILEDNNKCSDIFVMARGTTKDETSDLSLSCPPGFIEEDDICKEINLCEESSIMCTDNEICITLHGLFRCLAAPCSDGYERDPVNKRCIMDCTKPDSECDTGAEIAQELKYLVLNPEIGSILAYQDITKLEVRDEDGTVRPHTSYRIKENEEGKPFRVKLVDGEGVLYSNLNLPAGHDYRTIVEADTYDGKDETILHSTKFIILIRLSDDTTSILKR